MSLPSLSAFAQLGGPSHPSAQAAGARATQAAHVNRLLNAGAGGATTPSPSSPPHSHSAPHPSTRGYVERAMSEVGMRMIFG